MTVGWRKIEVYEIMISIVSYILKLKLSFKNSSTQAIKCYIFFANVYHKF